MEELRRFTLQLSQSNKIGVKALKRLLGNYNSIENLYLNFQKNPELVSNIAKIDIDLFLRELQSRNIKFICFWEDKYPTLLRECEDFPIVIYYVGNSDLLINYECISIVGTRKITFYGKKILENLVPSIKTNVIVSGLAYGIDAYAHKLALENKLPTIAVLPFSCDTPTPLGNSSLYRKILESGNLVISEIPPGKASHNGFFPRRNRIIAGLSKKTIVVEAGIKSGALITADLAFNYNREVYAYPGNINSSMSLGCNYLIKNNIAQLIESPVDLGLNSKDLKSILKLDPIERQIYYAILAGQKSLNELSLALNLDIQFLSGICTNLEINGILNTDNQNKFYVS